MRASGGECRVASASTAAARERKTNEVDLEPAAHARRDRPPLRAAPEVVPRAALDRAPALRPPADHHRRPVVRRAVRLLDLLGDRVLWAAAGMPARGWALCGRTRGLKS